MNNPLVELNPPTGINTQLTFMYIFAVKSVTSDGMSKLNIFCYCSRYDFCSTTLLFRDCLYAVGNPHHPVLLLVGTNTELC